MFQVVQFDNRQSDEPLQLLLQQEKPFDINDAFDFSLTSGGTRQPSADGTAEQLTIPSDGSSSGSGIGKAIVDVLLQPNVAPVSSGKEKDMETSWASRHKLPSWDSPTCG